MDQQLKILEQLSTDSLSLHIQPINDEIDRTVAGLFVVYLDLTKSIIELYKTKRKYSIDILMRSAFEYYIKISNIIEKENFWEIQLKDAQSDIDKIKLMGKENPIFSSATESQTFDKFIEDRELCISKCKENGATRGLNIFDQFEELDAVDFYRAVYWYLSNLSHANCSVSVRALNENDQPFEESAAPSIIHLARLSARLVQLLNEHFKQTGISDKVYTDFLTQSE